MASEGVVDDGEGTAEKVAKHEGSKDPPGSVFPIRAKHEQINHLDDKVDAAEYMGPNIEGFVVELENAFEAHPDVVRGCGAMANHDIRVVIQDDLL